MIKANQELNKDADKKEQARAISRTQNPMARGDEARTKEIESDIKMALDVNRSIWKARSRT